MAIPLDRDEFFADLDPCSPREYAKWYQWERGGPALLSTALWDQHYFPREVEPILRVIDEAQSSGVEVKVQCDLRGFIELASRRRVVTLVAHWPLGLLRAADIREPPRFVHDLAESPHPALRALRDTALADDPTLLELEFQALLKGLNAALWNVDLGLALGDERWPLRGAERVHENRRILNDALGESLGPPGGLELRDASYSAEAVRDALPSGYAGCLELIVCHSIVLAETIKRTHPSCRILANHTFTRPLVRLLVYAEAIRLLRNEDGDYFELLMHLRDQVASSHQKGNNS